jgi:uncharacterized membrane-anchored protein YhcB (DUF1043 family)
MTDATTALMWSTGLFGLAIGLAAGFGVAYWFVFKNKRSAKLQADLEQHKARFDAYQARVDEHFVKTSELFQDMTRHYGALHEHLAAGAQALCSDELITHAVTLPESSPMVEHKTAADKGAAEALEHTPATEPKPEPATPAATAAQPGSAEPEAPRQAGPADEPHNADDELEMESLAPRPPAPELHMEAGPNSAAPDEPEVPPSKRRLH